MINPKIFIPVEALRAAADIVDETNPNTIYLGFRNPRETDQGEDKPVWSILRIEKVLDITRFQWADGHISFNKQFTQRAGYDYYYLKG